MTWRISNSASFIHHFIFLTQWIQIFFSNTSAIVCPWLDFSSPPLFPHAVWCHWERLSRFLPRWLRTDWQSVISQGRIPSNTPPWWELNPVHGEDRQWDSFILPLSYHDPVHEEDRQWDTFILLLSYHDPGHREARQWDSFILPLSYHGPGHEEDRQWDTFILPLSYHDPSHEEDMQTVRYIQSPTELSWSTSKTIKRSSKDHATNAGITGKLAWR